jgi:hypothetical protein
VASMRQREAEQFRRLVAHNGVALAVQITGQESVQSLVDSGALRAEEVAVHDVETESAAETTSDTTQGAEGGAAGPPPPPSAATMTAAGFTGNMGCATGTGSSINAPEPEGGEGDARSAHKK